MNRDGSTEDRIPTWEEVARNHGRFLYTVAYRLTGNHDDAKDLVQEVLLRVRRGLETYRPGSMEGWLSRITTNAFLDEMRRRKRGAGGGGAARRPRPRCAARRVGRRGHGVHASPGGSAGRDPRAAAGVPRRG